MLEVFLTLVNGREEVLFHRLKREWTKQSCESKSALKPQSKTSQSQLKLSGRKEQNTRRSLVMKN